MRILLIHRYFWPDTPPYASMLLTIAKQLVEEGHDVEVFTSLPSYKSDSTISSSNNNEVLSGVKIKRIALFKESGKSMIFKLLNMLYFPLRIFIHLILNPSFNSVMSSTAPPVVTGFSSALGAKLIKAKFIYHCMDLHPEIGRISGEFKNKFVYKLLLKLDKWTCNNSENVIVLSQDMQNSLHKRYSENHLQNIEIINNFSLSDATQENIKDEADQYLKEKNTFRVLFAGNVGRFQMLDSFVDAIGLLNDIEEIELVFLGEGTALKDLKTRAKEKRNIKFFPHQNIEVAKKIMADADLGIVSLMPDVYRYAFPSKTMTYLAEGCPLLITVEPESELIEFITENKIGVSALPNNAESIANSIREIQQSPSLSKELSKNCVKVAKKEFSEATIIGKWSNLYNKLDGKKHV